MRDFDSIINVIRSLKMSYGQAFFVSLTSQLHKIIESDFTFIAELDLDSNVSKTIAFVTDDGVQENFEYSLEHTPCADVSNDSLCVYPGNVCQAYPDDQLLIDMGIKGYIGSPLHDSNGNVVGIMVALYKDDIQEPDIVSGILQFFEGRVSAELERSNTVKQLQELNANLELRINERTSELRQTMDSLAETQQQMLEQEKQASLGRLVVGVAHEINTPLGVSMLAGSTLESAVESLASSLANKSLTQSRMNQLRDEMKEACEILNANLQRAAGLVVNFKQISSDQIKDSETCFSVSEWLSGVLYPLRELAEQQGVEIRTRVDENVAQMCTFPAKLSQVITNLATNSILHAFSQAQKDGVRWCEIRCKLNSHNELLFSVIDNGIGLEPEVLSRLYEPFFTTSRAKGSTGLGMSIVYNLVTGPLKGKISVISEKGHGTHIDLVFPDKLTQAVC